MSPTALKILIIIILILVVLAILCITLEVGRSLTFGTKKRLFELDRVYHKLPRARSEEKVVITMTTTPQRIGVIFPTLASLLDQTVRVDEICLNIPYVSRKGLKYHIPRWLTRLKSVTLHRVEIDEGPSTKLLPTLRREDTRTRILVFDDDNIYHSQTVELLVNAFEQYAREGRRVAVTHYGVMLHRNGTIPKFLSFTRTRSMFCKPTAVDLLQGCHGFIVTPDFFPSESLDIRNRPPDAVSVDDIWFSCWLWLTGVEIRCLGSTWKHVPLVNFGDVNKTPKLVDGENKGLIRDQKVVNWFIHEKGYVPVFARHHSTIDDMALGYSLDF